MSTSQRRSLLKIALVGARGVGKTSLMGKYLDNKFPVEYRATLDAATKNTLIGNTPVTLMIWDIAGKERLEPYLAAFYRGLATAA